MHKPIRALAVLRACLIVLTGCGASGLYPVSVDGKWGYIDNTGNIKIQPQYAFAMPFSEGLATVRLNRKVGYIDRSGTLVVPMQYEFPSDFSEGLCMVVVEQSGSQKSGYIDKTGAMVIESLFTMAGDFSEGSAGAMLATDSSRRGYIDKNGDWVIELPGNLVPKGSAAPWGSRRTML